MNYHTDRDIHLVNIWLHIQKAFLLLATRCHYCPVYGGNETTKVAKRGEMSSPERDGSRDPLTNVQTGNWAMRFSNHVSDAFIHQSL